MAPHPRLRATPTALVAAAGAVLLVLAVAVGVFALRSVGRPPADAAGDPEAFCRNVGPDGSVADRVDRALGDRSSVPPASWLVTLTESADAAFVASAPAIDDPATPVAEDVRADLEVVLAARRAAETTGQVDDRAALAAAAARVDAYVDARCR